MMSNQDRLRALLNSGEELSLTEFARRLSVTPRQIRRLIKDLSRKGVCIEAKREGRVKCFWIPPGLRETPLQTHDLHLAADEVLALVIAAEASVAALGPTPLAAPLRRAFNRLLTTLGPNCHVIESEQLPPLWHFDPGAAAEIDPSVFQSVTRAIEDDCSIEIDYVTASTGKASIARKIDPYGIAVRGSSWLLVAYCRRRKAVLDFALAGITRVRVCDPEVDPDARFRRQEKFDMEQHFRDRFNALAGGKDYVIRLLVEPDRVPYFRRKEYHPTQQIEQVREDGRAIVSFDVSGLEEIRSFVQSWGVGVTVMEPPELVERIAREARELTERYAEGGVR